LSWARGRNHGLGNLDIFDQSHEMNLSLRSKCLLICIVPVVVLASLLASLAITFLQRTTDARVRRYTTVSKK